MKLKDIIAYIKERDATAAVWVLIIVIILIFISLFSGCKPSEKVQRAKALEFFDSHRAELATKCADEFPVKDSVGDFVLDSIRKAVNVNLADQLYAAWYEVDQLKTKFISDSSMIAKGYASQIQTITARISELNKQYKPCEPEIRYQTKTVYRESMARIYSLRADIDSMAKVLAVSRDHTKQALNEAEKAKKQATIRLWLLIGAGVLFGGGLFLHLKNII